MRNTLKEIVEDRLEELGISAAEAARRGGLKPTYIHDIKRGKVLDPRGGNLAKLAKALELEVWQLSGSGSTSTGQASDLGLPYKGIAQAGVFRNVDFIMDEQRLVVPIQRDMRYPKARQYVWKVEGDSMDRAAILPGMYALGIDFMDFIDQYHPLQNGDVVVVERSRFDGQEIEITIKRYWEDKEGVHLLPDSNNQKHQPIFVPRDSELQGETVRILAYVTGAFTLFGKPLIDVDQWGA